MTMLMASFNCILRQVKLTNEQINQQLKSADQTKQVKHKGTQPTENSRTYKHK